MTEKQNKLIASYWGRTELGRAMIASDYVSDSDLLFLIPNNVKRMHGCPATRCTANHKKREYKQTRRRCILSFRLFELIEEVIDNTLSKAINEEFFGQFVDFKNIAEGAKNCTYEYGSNVQQQYGQMVNPTGFLRHAERGISFHT